MKKATDSEGIVDRVWGMVKMKVKTQRSKVKGKGQRSKPKVGDSVKVLEFWVVVLRFAF